MMRRGFIGNYQALMQSPLPIRLIELLLAKSSRPVLTIGLCLSLPFLAAALMTGAIYPSEIFPWDHNPLEMTGLFLMMSVLPAYIMMSFTASTRLASAARDTLRAQLAEPADFDAATPVTQRWWPMALVIGWLFGLLFNVGWESLSFDPTDPRFAVSTLIVVGQLILWTAASLVLLFAIQEGLLLHRVGKLVQVDLYNLNKLNVFGRTALINLLLIMGALALTTLQSIDQNFRWDNYANAFRVVIPAACILIPLPIWSVHRRIKAAKHEEIGRLDVEIESSSRGFNENDLQRLNALLQRRELVYKLRNWPMDLSIVSRFVLYVFIPPLAWIGAALVEMSVDSFIGG